MTYFYWYLFSLFVNFLAYPTIGFFAAVNKDRDMSKMVEANVSTLNLYNNIYSRFKDIVRGLLPFGTAIYVLVLLAKNKFSIIGLMNNLILIRRNDWEIVKKIKTKKGTK